VHLFCAKLSPHNFVCMWSHDVTCVKSNVVWGPGPVVRRCSPQSLPDPAPRRPPTGPHLLQCADRRPPHPRAVRDVDLHRPATRRRRRVELPNPAVHIPVRGTSGRASHTHRTNACLQLYTTKPPLQRLLK
jgi:hypothetical protein